MSAAEDQADVEHVLAGDIAAFEGIVKRWQGPLVNLAFRFCRDRSRAEDMAQEAFLRAYRALGRWRQDAAFSTWLFALATNLYRSELRRIPAFVSLASIPDPRAATAPIEEDDEADQSVRRAVAALPPKYRDALVLFYFQEQDIPAASRTLNIPEGTLKARLSRGREILHRKLSLIWKVVHA